MDKTEFAQKVSELLVIKRERADSCPTLIVVKPDECSNISASNSPDSYSRERGRRFIRPFNSIIDAMAKRYNFVGYIDDLYATTPNDVNAHIVVAQKIPGSNDVVYNRTRRGYNNHGSGNTGPKQTKRKENTHMKNRKVTLTLFTLISGFALTLQITNSSKDATAWTRFCDPDLSKPEYDNITWTKDVASENQAAVDAVDAMIQIESDFAEGKLDKDAAVEQFKTKYIEWVLAHLSTNPEFVERRVFGLNCESPMSVYAEEAEAE